MSIGGIDVVLLAPSAECTADAILRACRSHWPLTHCIFQVAHEEKFYPFSDPWVWTVGTAKKEFSVYQDAAAVKSWRAEGAVSSNANSMFHFIVGDLTESDGLWTEVAMIFDKWTPEMRSFVKDLQSVLFSITPIREAA